MVSMFREFTEFLKQYGVIGLAIAVIIGMKLNELIKAVVDDLLMPFVGILIPGGNWRAFRLEFGPLKIGIGHFLGVSVDFTIVALVVFLIAKIILREEKVAKR
jgi:large conductance mechanosensitive channel